MSMISIRRGETSNPDGVESHREMLNMDIMSLRTSTRSSLSNLNVEGMPRWTAHARNMAMLSRAKKVSVAS